MIKHSVNKIKNGLVLALGLSGAIAMAQNTPEIPTRLAF
jgi:hypothetical protein